MSKSMRSVKFPQGVYQEAKKRKASDPGNKPLWEHCVLAGSKQIVMSAKEMEKLLGGSKKKDPSPFKNYWRMSK